LDYQNIVFQTEQSAPSVSVIIPTYNVKKYFQKAIGSLRKQTLQDIEIILVDDGSDDGTYEMCLQQEKEDSRIRVLRTEHNHGVAAARNQGLSAAKGRYISFIDSDDWVENDMLEYLLRLLQDADADIATCEVSKEYLDGHCKVEGSHKRYRTDGNRVIDEINYGGDFTPYLVDKLYKRELLETLKFRNGVSIGEDYSFLMEILIQNPVVMRGGECKYHYQQLSGSVTHRGFRNNQNTYKNRRGQKDTFRLLVEHDERLKDGALAYYVLQEMAVITSMEKSHRYDKRMIGSVRREVRKHLSDYLALRRVPFYLKCCAVLLSFNENLLLIPYRLLSCIVR